MQTVTTIGLDIAKSVFQAHGVDAAGQGVIRRQLKRRPRADIDPVHCSRVGQSRWHISSYAKDRE